MKQLFPPASGWEVVENTPIDGRRVSSSFADDGIEIELDEWAHYYDRPDEGWRAAQLKDPIDFSNIGALRGTFDIDIRYNLGDLLVQVVDPGGEVVASGEGRPDDRYRDSATGESFEVNTARVTGDHYIRFRPKLERPDATVTITLREMLADDSYYDDDPGEVLDNSGSMGAGDDFAEYGAELTGIERVSDGRFKATFIPRHVQINEAGLRTGFDVVAAVNGDYAGETSFGTEVSRLEQEQSVEFDASPGDWVQLVFVDETQQGIEFSISDQIEQANLVIDGCSLQTTQVTSGESTQVVIPVSNNGGVEGSGTVSVSVGGNTFDADVTLAGGESEAVRLDVTVSEPGEYPIEATIN